MGLFDVRDVYEIGSDYDRGWIELRDDPGGIRLSVCHRGEGHDEPAQKSSHVLPYAEIAGLLNALYLTIPPETEPSITPQWEPKICDVCQWPIRSQSDFAAGGHDVGKGIFKRYVSGEWHMKCRPQWFREKWSW